MKIALINNFPPYSGTGKVAYELFRNLRSFYGASGLSADLFCTHVMEPEEFLWEENREVKFLHGFPYKENETLSRLLIYFVDPYRIPRIYDLYHITNHMLGCFVSRLKPSVVTVHDVLQFKYRERMSNPFSSLIYNLLMEKSLNVLKCADRLICVSSWSADQVSRILKVSPEKIAVVHNGLDHALFYPRDKVQSRRKFNLPPESKIVLNVGSEIKRKNIKTLIKAMRRVVDRFPQALLLRLGDKVKQSEEFINDQRLTANVVYLDYVEAGEVPFVYSCADVSVIPSFEEGFGFPVVESQACGVPVIAGRRSSLPEVAGEACFYTREPENDAELSEAIFKIFSLTDSGRRRLVGEGLLNAGRFSWKKNADGIFRVYGEVIQETKGVE